MISGVLTASFRFLATVGFNNDHFVHLSAAQQMLFGDWPTRDFIDIGRPLTIVASAVTQRLLGHTLFAEALLVSAAFGIAAALTAAIVFELTGSLFASYGAAAFEVVAFPRSYSYPKVLMTATGVWLIGYFLRRPSFARQVLMAAGVTMAFLFRHDLGLFVAAGGVVASILATPSASWWKKLRCAMTFVALVAAMVTPYLVYVQLNGGLSNYFATALDQNRGEAGYVWPTPFAAGASADARLLYVFHLLPLIALGICALEWKRSRDRWAIPFVISVASLAVAENFGLMRDLLKARIPDAIVPAVVLGAWLAYRLSFARPRYLLIPSAVALLVAGVWVSQLGDLTENLDRASLTSDTLLHPWVLPSRFANRSARLHDRFGSSPPSRVIVPLRPFFSYVDRCTTPRHRLFLAGMIPEVAYYAQRPFAGGGYEHYNFRSRINQERVVDRLRHEVVPFALIPSESADELKEDLPIVSGYLAERYVPLDDVSVYEDLRLQILVDKDLPSTSRDAETGWPCYR